MVWLESCRAGGWEHPRLKQTRCSLFNGNSWRLSYESWTKRYRWSRRKTLTPDTHRVCELLPIPNNTEVWITSQDEGRVVSRADRPRSHAVDTGSGQVEESATSNSECWRCRWRNEQSANRNRSRTASWPDPELVPLSSSLRDLCSRCENHLKGEMWHTVNVLFPVLISCMCLRMYSRMCLKCMHACKTEYVYCDTNSMSSISTLCSLCKLTANPTTSSLACWEPYAWS